VAWEQVPTSVVAALAAAVSATASVSAAGDPPLCTIDSAMLPTASPPSGAPLPPSAHTAHATPPLRSTRPGAAMPEKPKDDRDDTFRLRSSLPDGQRRTRRARHVVTNPLSIQRRAVSAAPGREHTAVLPLLHSCTERSHEVLLMTARSSAATIEATSEQGGAP
jgi:hypothetical protein